MKTTYEDNLLVITEKVIRRGKRVAKDCPVSAEVRWFYVKHGALAAVKRLAELEKINLEQAYMMFKIARGRRTWYVDGVIVRVDDENEITL